MFFIFVLLLTFSVNFIAFFISVFCFFFGILWVLTDVPNIFFLKAVKYYKKINNYVSVCKIFECSERSLKRWVEKYDKNVERKKKDHIKLMLITLNLLKIHLR